MSMDNRIVSDNDIIKANALFTEGKYTEALPIYEAGMKNGHTRAIFNYAYCLQYGYGIDPDPAKAFELYTYLRYEEEGVYNDYSTQQKSNYGGTNYVGKHKHRNHTS